MNARHTPSLESLLERHREGGAFPTYAELSALAAPAAPSEQAEASAPDDMPFLNHWDLANHDYGFGIEFSTAYRAARAAWFAATTPSPAPSPSELQDGLVLPLVAAPVSQRGATAVDAADFIDKKANNWSAEYGCVDHETGALEFLNVHAEEYYNSLRELADDIRALPAAAPGSSIGDDPEFDRLAEAWGDLLILASSPTSFDMYDKRLAEARAALVVFLDKRGAR